jgi:hypothetical protein
MTIAATNLRGSQAGPVAHSTNIAFSIPIFASEDLVIWKVIDATNVRVLLVEVTDYDVVLLLPGALPSAGDFQLTVAHGALAAGETLYFERRTDIIQETQYLDASRFPGDSFEYALDRETLLSQELLDRALRSPYAPPEDGDQDWELPEADERAGKSLRFDGSGQPIVVTDAGGFIGVRSKFIPPIVLPTGGLLQILFTDPPLEEVGEWWDVSSPGDFVVPPGVTRVVWSWRLYLDSMQSATQAVEGWIEHNGSKVIHHAGGADFDEPETYIFSREINLEGSNSCGMVVVPGDIFTLWVECLPTGTACTVRNNIFQMRAIQP